MGPAQPKPARKRHRKRKRRVASDSSSSEDDSLSSSSDSSTQKTTVTVPVRQPKPVESANSDESEDDTSSSSDESRGNSEPDEEDPDVVPQPSRKPKRSQAGPHLPRDSPSPEPSVAIPPFLHPDVPESEQALKEKFRKFWMAAIAEGFKDDLEEIRKEPNLGPSRLGLLIESLASGADVFSSSATAGRVNEMEIVLDQVP